MGSALQDFYAARLGERIPISRVRVTRIPGSAALAMSNGEMRTTPLNAGANSFPIVFNNACVSWHELAGRFMFGAHKRISEP